MYAALTEIPPKGKLPAPRVYHCKPNDKTCGTSLASAHKYFVLNIPASSKVLKPAYKYQTTSCSAMYINQTPASELAIVVLLSCRPTPSCTEFGTAHRVFIMTTLLYAIIIGLLCLYLFRQRSTSSLPLPPGPAPLPIVGNVHQAPKSHSWRQFHAWGNQYGPLVHLNMLGQHVIVLSTSKAARDLLATRGATFSDRPRLVVSSHARSHSDMRWLTYGHSWLENSL